MKAAMESASAAQPGLRAMANRTNAMPPLLSGPTQLSWICSLIAAMVSGSTTVSAGVVSTPDSRAPRTIERKLQRIRGLWEQEFLSCRLPP